MMCLFKNMSESTTVSHVRILRINKTRFSLQLLKYISGKLTTKQKFRLFKHRLLLESGIFISLKGYQGKIWKFSSV